MPQVQHRTHSSSSHWPCIRHPWTVGSSWARCTPCLSGENVGRSGPKAGTACRPMFLPAVAAPVVPSRHAAANPLRQPRWAPHTAAPAGRRGLVVKAIKVGALISAARACWLMRVRSGGAAACSVLWPMAEAPPPCRACTCRQASIPPVSFRCMPAFKTCLPCQPPATFHVSIVGGTHLHPRSLPNLGDSPHNPPAHCHGPALKPCTGG